MRNKFTELIEQGVASFNYTPIAPEMPEQDPICRAYNNIWSIPSDTHMSCIKDETGEECRVITGRMVSQGDKWGMFTQSTFWGAVNFRTTGYWCLADFLWKHNLEYRIGELNGDVVAFVTPMTKADAPEVPIKVSTNESQIPQPVTVITNTGNMMHVVECFKGSMEETVNNLNNSTWIQGNNWVANGDKIIGLVGNKIYIL